MGAAAPLAGLNNGWSQARRPLKHMRVRGTPLFCAADVPEKLWKLPIKTNKGADYKRTDVASPPTLSDIPARSSAQKTIGRYVGLAVFQRAHTETYVALSMQGGFSVEPEGTSKSPRIVLYAGGGVVVGGDLTRRLKAGRPEGNGGKPQSCQT